MNEFARIARYFAPLAAPAGLGLADDAAVLRVPAGIELVLSTDAIVAGVHFFADDPPDLVARKLLRVNLSDLAAMGAAPVGYLLTVSVPSDTDDAWFAQFAAGLAADQAVFGIGLLGGDSTATPGPVSLSATVLGQVPAGTALRRAGARDGDALWVSGTIGEAALGLRVRQGGGRDPEGRLAGRYALPEPRLALGLALRGQALACLDVSDGLVQDAGHLARAAGLGVLIEAARVPVAAGGEALAACLTGGDDYELLFATPPDWHGVEAGVRVTRIGRFTAAFSGVRVTGLDGEAMVFARAGWQHYD